LDRHYLGPSRFDAERRERLAGRFADAATKAAPGVPYRLEFRATSEESINAFALPGGVVIVLDGLVRFAGDDAAVLGVLGHELGHVAYRHSTRQVLQSVGVGMLAGLLWGDFSGTAASVPLVLGVLKYSRGFEREADDFAIAFLRANEISIGPFYDVLVRLAEREEHRGIATLPDFISTHPSLAERIEHLLEALDDE
ncbi:MAG: peptidase M48, partial [Candidatus Rokuibacteriota bacterium]